MRYISLFSGIEAATVAWQPLGFEPIAFCEIDPFCCALLEHYYPNVPNLGDITNVNFKRYRNKCDIIIGGSPCQSFSIAGDRTGRAGESGLMAEYIRAVREVRPRWLVWENVPGALSVERGEAFRQLLSELEKLGYCVAWRVLDAQFFGVAQRRRRVFVVGSLGDMRSADVLFEPESLSGDIESSREKREALTRAADGRADGDCAAFLGGNSPTAGSIGYEDELSPTLKSGASGTNMVHDVITQYGELAGTLSARHDSSACADRGQNVICLQTDHMGQNGRNHSIEICKTLDVASSTPVVAYAQNQRGEIRLKNGDGQRVGALASQPDFSKGQGASLICIADDNAKAAIDDDLCGTLKVGGGRAVNSSGTDFTGPLCARDYKGVSYEFVEEGKVICQISS